jgi:hypothetical protein
MINGVYADEAYKLDPEQWVNVYHLDFMDEAIYHSSCQVKELNLEYPEEYGLELVDENGDLMSFKEAFNRMKVKDGIEAVGECQGCEEEVRAVRSKNLTAQISGGR